jgi:hypothetical protein
MPAAKKMVHIKLFKAGRRIGYDEVFFKGMGDQYFLLCR